MHLSPDTLRDAFAQQTRIESWGIEWTIIDLIEVEDAMHGRLMRVRMQAQADPEVFCFEGMMRLTLRAQPEEGTCEEHLAKCRIWVESAIDQLPLGVVVSRTINSLLHHSETCKHPAIETARTKLADGSLETKARVLEFVRGIE
jgi:hypothetical protein